MNLAADRQVAAARSDDPVSWALLSWCWQAAWRQQPGAIAAAIFALALGVALALGIDLVNRSALQRFSAAMNTINGQADLRLEAPDGRLPDTLVDALRDNKAVAIASPIIDALVPLLPRPKTNAQEGSPDTLRIIGLDVFEAAQISLALLPQRTNPDGTPASGISDALFADDAIFLSAKARSELQLVTGDSLHILVNGRRVTLTVAGSLPGVPADHALAVMDIGAAQWQLGWLDKLSRIDIRLAEDATTAQLKRQFELTPALQASQWILTQPDQAAQRMSNLSRAYRVNLNALALVALFTGSFIVYATMSLAVTRLVPMLALLGVLGAPRRIHLLTVLGLAVAMGLFGALLGVVMGFGLAELLLRAVGGDLGGGYFGAGYTSISAPPAALAGFASLGVLAAVAGALAPALRLRTIAPAQALRSGQHNTATARTKRGRNTVRRASGLLTIGALLLTLPAIANLPIAAYLAIACWLFAGVALTGPLSQWLMRCLARDGQRAWRQPMAWLSLQRLASHHSSAAAALAGVVASFALVSAMAIMVHSFRDSVQSWLDTVLPADIYLRIPMDQASAGIDRQMAQQLQQIPGIARLDFLRSLDLQLNPAEPAINLLAQTIDPDNPAAQLPISGMLLPISERRPSCIAIYASEPAALSRALRVGDTVSLPIELDAVRFANAKPPCFQIVGIWRDYARQHGALAINMVDYQHLTGDNSVSNAAIRLQPEARSEPVMQSIRSAFADVPGLQMRTNVDIRALSLRIFDRSFAVTYALEAVALLVGLFGVATTYAGEALARAREFGMLRHLGITRAQLSRLFAAEAAVSIMIGVLWGALMGAVIAQVLIHWVNPQSFHWTMQTSWPIALLLYAGAGLVLLGTLSSLLAARSAGGRAPVAAVKADW